MKLIIVRISCLLFSSSIAAQKIYVASIPAGSFLRTFLNIPLKDSVNFIRVKLSLTNNNYQLHFNYGIGKPNTNGFINGGTKNDFNGIFNKEKNIYHLNYKNKVLNLIELNNDLLHVLDASNNLLIGNGGWSYTLNNITPLHEDKITATSTQNTFKDSLVYEGRTPCGVPGVIEPSKECYKLKWLISFYNNDSNLYKGEYIIKGTPYRNQGIKKGNWEMVKQNNGNIFFLLKDDAGKIFLHLLKADNNILLFTDEQEKLLVGNEDFSYTLNKK
jgi:hypothetical protein